jgi:hypothetical protein
VSHPDDPTVPRPCPVPASQLEPREKGRHCMQCDTLVLDTALHTRAELLAIVGRREKKVCAHLRSDGAGRVRFADSPFKRRLSVVALSAALVGCGEDVGVTVGPPSAQSPDETPEGSVDQIEAPDPDEELMIGEPSWDRLPPPEGVTAPVAPPSVPPGEPAVAPPPGPAQAHPPRPSHGRASPPEPDPEDDDLNGHLE